MLSRMFSPFPVRSALARRLPILAWLPQYSSDAAVADLVAGVTVGLTLIPQAIAYAALAGMPAQYGLYSALTGGFVYTLLGTCKDVSIGLTALLALLTSSYTHGTHPDMAVLLCFLSGCVELMCGVLQLGFLVDFVSVPVVNGFTSAAAVIIASSQLKGVLGLTFRADGFFNTWRQLARNIWRANVWDVALGAACIVVLLSLRKLKDIKPTPEDGKPPSGNRRALERLLWFMSIGRNAMVVVACTAAAFVFDSKGLRPFLLTGAVDAGLPVVAPPPFSTEFGNRTYSFTDMCSYLGSGLAVVPVISIIGNVAIAKAFSAGEVVDATQEMVALGVCNMLGAFFRSMPVNGSFSCSAVNNASGVRTQLGAVYTGVMVLLALSLLTPYFYFIPRATLSAVIICAVIFMVNVDIISPMWRSSKLDLVPTMVTFFTSLWLGVEMGIVIGIAVDVVFLLYFTARPSVAVERVQGPAGVEYISVTPSTGLQFPAVDFVREAVTRAGGGGQEEAGRHLAVVVDCSHVHRADFTAAQGVCAMLRDLGATGRRVVFHGLRPRVADTLSAVCGAELVCATSEDGLMEKLAGLPTDAEVSKL